MSVLKQIPQQLPFLDQPLAPTEAQAETKKASANGQAARRQQAPAPKMQADKAPRESKQMASTESVQGRNLAPMLQHYVDLKQEYREHLLLFQVGDFYEVFFEDAITASEILNIRLTSRDKDAKDPIPMCGVPHHALDNYLPKLLSAGCSCVIVSQVEEANKAKKGPVRREITRIVTPGVRYEGDGLTEHHYNYLAAICFGAGDLGAVAYVDISTGHLRVRETESLDALLETLDRVAPSECILPSAVFGIPVGTDEGWLRAVRNQLGGLEPRLVRRPFERAVRSGLEAEIRTLLPGLDASALESLSPYALTAISVALAYVAEVSFSMRPSLASFTVEQSQGSLVIDSATRSNLELFSTRLRGEEKHSLLRHINFTRTAMGARLLADWILAPSCERDLIHRRLDAVEELSTHPELLEEIRATLLGMRDLDRLCTRITSGRANPADLAVLRDCLELIPRLQEVLEQCQSAQLQELAEDNDLLADVQLKLQAALVQEPPMRISDGGIFAQGWSEALDSIRSVRRDGKSWLKALEERYREESGISGLKVKYNNVFGYFIEVSKTHVAKVPAEYERKQTLTNVERFVTPELKEREVELLSAHTRQLDLEKELFGSLRAEVAAEAYRLQRVAHIVAAVDVLASLSHCANRNNFVRPDIEESHTLHIVRGRHPVVEQVLGAHAFVPNNCELDTGKRRLAILTGPNMGGKSTYLRQVGLIQLLAQAGSFVPAAEARLPIVDRIFTRIGAADDLSKGESTFMVEMREMSVILRNATKRSLVLIDEVGRGTATSDGLSIATAVAEWLLERVQCMCIFATHFHQLTRLSDIHQGAFCLSVGVLEQEGSISFTHRIEESRGDRSYGIEVARLAGLPDALLQRACTILQGIEPELLDARPDMQGPTARQQGSALASSLSVEIQPPAEYQEVVRRLKAMRIDSMTPLQSMQELAELWQVVVADKA